MRMWACAPTIIIPLGRELDPFRGDAVGQISLDCRAPHNLRSGCIGTKDSPGGHDVVAVGWRKEIR